MAVTGGWRDLSITAGVAATLVGSHNNARQYLLIQNLHDTATIYVRFAARSASVMEPSDTPIAAVVGAASNVKLQAGASLIFENGFIPAAAFSIISTSASTPVTIYEG